MPDSAGSYAAGQDQALAALRAAGLIEALAAAGLEVRDGGDMPEQVWRPDRSRRYAQNVGQVVACLQELTSRLGPLLTAGGIVLVIGGELYPTRAAGDPAVIHRFADLLPATLATAVTEPGHRPWVAACLGTA